MISQMQVQLLQEMVAIRTEIAHLKNGQKEAHNTENPVVPKSKPKPKYSDQDLQTAKFILDTIRATNDIVEPNMDMWAKEVRLMREIDKRSHVSIRDAIIYAHQDPFWTINCQSPKKLRKHFDRFHNMRKQETKKQGVSLDGYRKQR